MFELDHLVVATKFLEDGRDWVEELLGVKLQPGGRHAHFGTHNLLLGLQEGLYLEVISIDPEAEPPGYPRWFGLDRFEGPSKLNNWCCRVTCLNAALVQYPQAGEPLNLERDDLKWKMAVPEHGALLFDGLFPALIEWQTAPHPAKRLPESGCRLERLTVRHPQAVNLAAELSRDLTDPKVTFEVGAPELEAEISTPGGMRLLT